MKNLPLIFACLGSGIAGAAALDLITPTEKGGQSSQEEVLVALRHEFDSLQAAGRAEREALEARLARMEDEARLVAPSQARSLVPEQAGKSISDDNLPVLASHEAIRIGTTVIQPEQFEAWVQRASDSIEERKQMERDQERLVREGERIEEQVAKLTTDLGLDQHQQSEFRRHLQDTGTQRRDLFQAMRDGEVDRSAMRESMDKMRDENDADLRTFLSEQQFTTYKESGADNPFGRGGGPGGGQRNNRGTGGNNNASGANNTGGGADPAARGRNRGQGN